MGVRGVNRSASTAVGDPGDALLDVRHGSRIRQPDVAVRTEAGAGDDGDFVGFEQICRQIIGAADACAALSPSPVSSFVPYRAETLGKT